MIIREILPEDQPQLARIFQQVFTAPPWNEHWSEASASAVLDEWLPLQRFYGLVAVIDEELVGFVFGRLESWDTKQLFYVKELGVLPGLRRAGIGSALTETLEVRMKERGVDMLYLNTLKDSPAAEFYSAREYRASKRMVMYSKTFN